MPGAAGSGSPRQPVPASLRDARFPRSLGGPRVLSGQAAEARRLPRLALQGDCGVL